MRARKIDKMFINNIFPTFQECHAKLNMKILYLKDYANK